MKELVLVDGSVWGGGGGSGSGFTFSVHSTMYSVLCTRLNYRLRIGGFTGLNISNNAYKGILPQVL